MSNSSKNTALLNEKRFSRCVVLLSVFITMALITGIFIISSAQNGMENKTRVTKIRSIGKKTCCFIVSVTVIFTTCVLKAYFKNINNSFEIGLKFLVFAVIPICKAYARREKQFFLRTKNSFIAGLQSCIKIKFQLLQNFKTEIQIVKMNIYISEVIKKGYEVIKAFRIFSFL